MTNECRDISPELPKMSISYYTVHKAWINLGDSGLSNHLLRSQTYLFLQTFFNFEINSNLIDSVNAAIYDRRN